VLRIQLAASTFKLSEVVDMRSGTTKNSTWLVNDTPVALDLYYATSNDNRTFRKTLYPKPRADNDTTVEVTSTTGVTTDRNGVEQVGDINTYIEEFNSNNTYATLRLWVEKTEVLYFDTDKLSENSEIRIDMSSDGEFTPRFTAR
jgi:hypothetical protein